MSTKPKDTEFALWEATVPDQRSFLVEVLHWFHYRHPALKRSWAREEVMTWELLQALEMLPQSLFLRPLLRHIAGLSDETNRAIAPLLASSNITVTRYPSLKLRGTKRNCKSDIGFGLSDGPTIWVEAKTAPFNDAALREQVAQQRQALAILLPSTPTAIVTLLPRRFELSGIANIGWHTLATLFETGVAALRSALPTNDYRAGYEKLAVELIQRIYSHPNELAISRRVVQQDAPADDPAAASRRQGRG